MPNVLPYHLSRVSLHLKGIGQLGTSKECVHREVDTTTTKMYPANYEIQPRSYDTSVRVLRTQLINEDFPGIKTLSVQMIQDSKSPGVAL